MHGRVRVRRTEEQEKIREERKRKLQAELKTALGAIFESRRSKLYSDVELKNISAIIEIATEMATLWNYRREIYETLLKCQRPDENIEAMDRELEVINRCLLKYPKSYALWHHRTWVMKTHPTPPWNKEVEFCDSALSMDERNFHCWDYRRFVVQYGGITISSELAFTDRAIESNMSNFSAWHYRGELLSSSIPETDCSLPISPPPIISCNGSLTGTQSLVPPSELELVHNAVFTDPKDQSPWSYYWWLLGRGKRRAYLRDLYISRSLARVVLVFTAAKPYSALQQLVVLVKLSGQTMDPIHLSAKDLDDWQSALSESISAVWWLSISADTLDPYLSNENISHDELKIEVQVCIKDIDNSGEQKACEHLNCPADHLFCYNCVLEPCQNESLMRVDLNPKRLLNLVVSPTNEPQTLVEELHSVRELLSMEPDNKWALRTYLALLHFVNVPGSSDEIDSTLLKLKDVDEEHRIHYTTISESFAIQDMLMNGYQAEERAICINDLSITGLQHIEWFALMTKIDLSNNLISQIPDTFAYLVCLCELIMDNNKLSTLIGVSRLPSLLEISVKHNSLHTFASIEELLYCPKMKRVSLEGNQVTNIRDLSVLLAEHPQSTTKSHSFVLTYDKPLDI